MSSGVCAACRRSIDESAKVCPYCGADPGTGERLDTQALLQEVFQPKTLTRSESVMEYARQRQGIVIGVSVALVVLLLAALHSFVTARNARDVSEAPAVPLSEVVDVATHTGDTAQAPLPELDFQYAGRPQTMRTMIVEPGAVAPPQPPQQPQPGQPQTPTPATATSR
jgi:hypothetical protein